MKYNCIIIDWHGYTKVLEHLNIKLTLVRFVCVRIIGSARGIKISIIIGISMYMCVYFYQNKKIKLMTKKIVL